MYKKIAFSAMVITLASQLCLAVNDDNYAVAGPSLEADAGGSEWFQAEKRTRNAVVQVLTRGVEFNWLEPYKSPDQKGAAGTAFFIDKRGYLLTNYHVIAGAKSVVIHVPEVGRQPLEVSIVGVCPYLDFALLKLTDESRNKIVSVCGPINALDFGNSDELYHTQRVLTKGFPLGFHTIKSTDGGVAGRDFHRGRSLIHITAAINPGNSGGPLLNKEGKVLGINTASVRDAQNYNYVVPINDILIILNDLYKNKLVRRPTLGVGINRGTDEHARALGNPVPSGLYISYVYSSSIEEKAGVKAGDMLYEIIIEGATYQIDEFGEVTVPWRSGQKISAEELLSRCRIGQKITLVIYRNGARKELVTTYELPTLPYVRDIYADFEPEECDYEMIGGMVIMQLRYNHIDLFEEDKYLANLLEFRDCARPSLLSKPALVITTILASSQADMSECMHRGFILDKVNGKTVTTLAELREALMLSAKTNEISIETKDKYTTVLSLSKVLQDEERLARDYIFPISPIVKKLMAAIRKK